MLRLSGTETASAPRDAGFQAALECIAAAHSQEVNWLHEENSHLRDELAQLKDYLRQVQASNIFARFDEPKMQSVAECVAADLASWIDSGGEVRAVVCADGAPEQRQSNPNDGPLQEDAGRGAGELHQMVEMSARCRTQSSGESPRSPGSRQSPGAMVASVISGKKRQSSSNKFTEVLVSKEGLKLTQKTMKLKEESKSQRWHSRHPKSVTTSRSGWSFVEWIVHHSVFSGICATMIVFNSGLIGVSTQLLIVNGEEEGRTMLALGHFCTAFFIVELVLRILAERAKFVTSVDMRYWNLFDSVLVAFSVVELGVAVGDNAIGGAVKTIKMLRIFRLLRVFRFFKELSLLTLMVIDSMKSLFNALMMLIIITYVFAICFTQQAATYVHDHDNSWPEPKSQDVAKYFGSLWQTVYTLIQAMLSGVSWGVLSDALREISAFPFALFFFYVFFTMLAVLNIITGVFVDNAVETARTQRDFMIQKEMELKEMYVKEMRKLFAQIDEDGSGTVSLEEVKGTFEDPCVKSYFQALGLDPQDSERLFLLLDSDGTGDVSVDEFIDGCLRLKGQARSIDIYELLLKTNRVEMRLKDLTDTRRSLSTSRETEACRGFWQTDNACRAPHGRTLQCASSKQGTD